MLADVLAIGPEGSTMRRIISILAAAATAALLAAAPAWADEPVPAPVVTGLPAATEEPAPEPCIGEPFEIAPGEWDCVIEEAPTVDVEEPTDEPEPVGPEPEPEPVEVVEDNGDWGWSDAREMYAL